MSIRVRFAPSPTGFMHVGNARTALFNYLFAKHQKGQWLVRIEDTDQERHQEASIVSILKNLKWLGLDWDEGLFLNSQDELISKGSLGPYRQSERLSLYHQEIEKLIQQDKAYYCFLSEEEENKNKEKAKQESRPYYPFSPYRDTPLETAKNNIQQGMSHCVRFKNTLKNKEYVIEDMIRGKISFLSQQAGDFILIRSDGYPVYNFSCAIDDALMKITHILRGEEHIPNTLKQILIHEALGFKTPQVGHLSIILGEDKKKMSKRSGAKMVEDFKSEGFLPQALINFLSLLGWNPNSEQEFFSKQELIQSFKIEQVNLSPAIFNEDKLLWLNKEHIKSFSNKELWEALQVFLKKAKLSITKNWEEVEKIIEATKSGFKTLAQATDILKHFADDAEKTFQLSSECEPVLSWPKSQQVVEAWKNCLENLKTDYLNEEDFKNIQTQIQNNIGVKGRHLFMPLRCAVLGQPQGMEIKVLATSLNRDKLIKRTHKLLKSFLPKENA